MQPVCPLRCAAQACYVLRASTAGAGFAAEHERRVSGFVPVNAETLWLTVRQRTEVHARPGYSKRVGSQHISVQPGIPAREDPGSAGGRPPPLRLTIVMQQPVTWRAASRPKGTHEYSHSYSTNQRFPVAVGAFDRRWARRQRNGSIRQPRRMRGRRQAAGFTRYRTETCASRRVIDE